VPLSAATPLGAVLMVSSTCPGPRVTGAQAAGPESVIVSFDRRIDPATVLADGSQFSIAGLTVTGASAPGNREVRLETSAQAPRRLYTVTVASTVRDNAGTGVEPASRTGTFRGWKTPAVLRITEIAPGVANQRDLMELVVRQSGSTEGITVVDAASVNPLATLPDVEVLEGDLVVIHFTPDRVTPGVDAPGSELTSKTAWPQAPVPSTASGPECSPGARRQPRPVPSATWGRGLPGMVAATAHPEPLGTGVPARCVTATTAYAEHHLGT